MVKPSIRPWKQKAAGHGALIDFKGSQQYEFLTERMKALGSQFVVRGQRNLSSCQVGNYNIKHLKVKSQEMGPNLKAKRGQSVQGVHTPLNLLYK